MSVPPVCVSPLVDRTWKTPPPKSINVTSWVPPPKLKNSKWQLRKFQPKPRSGRPIITTLGRNRRQKRSRKSPPRPRRLSLRLRRSARNSNQSSLQESGYCTFVSYWIEDSKFIISQRDHDSTY